MSKLKVSIKGVKEIGAATRKMLSQGIEDRKTMNDVAEIIHKSIYGSARDGKNPDGEKFQRISEGWAKRKHSLSKVNKTADVYVKGKSNLTFTGQLLNSFGFKINKNIISFFFAGNRRPYKGLMGGNLATDSETNAELAEKIEKTRPFVFLGKKTAKRVSIEIVRSLKRKLKDFKRVSKLLSR